MLYNNAGLISKVSEEIAHENAENCRRRQPHCRLPSHHQDICITLYCQKVDSLGYIFAANSMGLSSFKFFVVGSERRLFCAIECVTVVQSHPMSLILAPIERAYATSY